MQAMASRESDHKLNIRDRVEGQPTSDASLIVPAPSLIGLSPEALQDAVGSLGVAEKSRRMRARQLWNWFYARGAHDFDEMTSISKDLRSELAANFSMARPKIVDTQISNDGTRKWLLQLAPHVEVEAVYIPESDRGTLCISSQVGCTLNCSFCHTGTQPWVRNLSAAEIVGQILVARDELEEWPTPNQPAPARRITNVVMMGMGEPLFNFDNVRDALLLAADGEGIALGKRRVTLSTSGVVPMMKRAGDEIGCMLAISLHAVNDDLRDELVPINRKYPLAELLDACRNYPGVSNARRITFEYVMLKGVNDSKADAKALVQLIKGIPAKINLIPFNPWPDSPYECSDWDQIESFGDIVNRAGYASPIRTPRGRDIDAACGQLKSASRKKRASELRRDAEQREKNKN